MNWRQKLFLPQSFQKNDQQMHKIYTQDIRNESLREELNGQLMGFIEYWKIRVHLQSK